MLEGLDTGAFWLATICPFILACMHACLIMHPQACLGEADAARHVVTMGQLFGNMKMPTGGHGRTMLCVMCRGSSDVLSRMRSWSSRKNWCRNLHRLIHRFGMTLGVEVTVIEVPCLVAQVPRVLPWPVLLPSSWVNTIMKKTSGQPLLGKFTLGQKQKWQDMFKEFWHRFKATSPGHGIFTDLEKRNLTHLCVPYMLHGDEGRGKLKRAVMCASMQPVIHEPGHTFLSRFLYGIIPSELYAEADASFDTMVETLVDDLQKLYRDGVEVPWFLVSLMHVHACMQARLIHV